MAEITIDGFPEPVEVDDNVVGLVQSLNTLPGIFTTASCGGPPDPGPGQHPAGEFDVSLEADLNMGGWRSLEILAWAAGELQADLVAWGGTDGPRRGSLCFDLSGTADPDEAAELIGEARGRYDET